MRRAPVCEACKTELSCKRNGHIVDYASGRRYSSDLYQCLHCEYTVAILSDEPHPDMPLNGVRVKPDLLMREDQ
jgi:hypothetical protein